MPLSTITVFGREFRLGTADEQNDIVAYSNANQSSISPKNTPQNQGKKRSNKQPVTSNGFPAAKKQKLESNNSSTTTYENSTQAQIGQISQSINTEKVSNSHGIALESGGKAPVTNTLKSSASIEVLSDDLLIKILDKIWLKGDFQFLCCTELVCKKWKTIIRDLLQLQSPDIRWNSKFWQVYLTEETAPNTDSLNRYAWFDAKIMDVEFKTVTIIEASRKSSKTTVTTTTTVKALIKELDFVVEIISPSKKKIRFKPKFARLRDLNAPARNWIPFKGQQVEVFSFIVLHLNDRGYYSCNICHLPIKGERYHCEDCGLFDEDSFDVCGNCKQHVDVHSKRKRHLMVLYPDSDTYVRSYYTATVSKVMSTKVIIDYTNALWKTYGPDQTQNVILDADIAPCVVLSQSELKKMKEKERDRTNVDGQE